VQDLDKDDKVWSQESKNKFILSYETMEDTSQGVKTTIFPTPWDEFFLHIIKYITCEGRHSLMLAYHFMSRVKLRYFSYLKPKYTLSIPNFLLHHMKEMLFKVQRGNRVAMTHCELVKIINSDSLTRQQHKIT
jgi:hypothetical protein